MCGGDMPLSLYKEMEMVEQASIVSFLSQKRATG